MNIFNLFPTPVGFIPGVITQEECNDLIDLVVNCDKLVPNQNSDKLTHTAAGDSLKGPQIEKLFDKLAPHIRDFGYQLLGDNSLDWHMVGLWGNIMNPGGWQFKHNHGNSVISGVIYLQMPEGASATRFWRKDRGDTYFLAHDGEGDTTDYNCGHIDLNNVKATDMVLFPSYLNHSVEQSGVGEDRISIAFNVVPNRLNILDTYYLKLSFD
jgi:uncharacterized protein (TIGR02466 family)